MPAIWWIRHDLRLIDNPSLQSALLHGGVIPVFILDDHLLSNAAPLRRDFLFSGLMALDHSLRSCGSQLIIRQGPPLPALRQLMMETQAEIIYAQEDFTPYSHQRDDAIGIELPLKLVHGITYQHPENVLKADGKPYTIFTPFSKAWKALPLHFPGEKRPVTFPSIPLPASISMPSFSDVQNFPAGENAAVQKLESFISNPIFDYQQGRNLLAESGTSCLSPYLRFGMLSLKVVVQAAHKATQNALGVTEKASAEAWLNELIWRDFYENILFHFPFVLMQAFNPTLREIPWRNAPGDLIAWQQGFTGYPIVDAGMRQLLQTGWMHNRARMITASFLTKDLLINWQEGERWFMAHLVDGDPASNNGGWQWTAGVGTDAAPWFRIFNPVLQGKKFDPEGKYVRRWLPELEAVPDVFIQEPWTMPECIQQQVGCIIQKHYPAPIVDHKTARMRALASYGKMRQGKSI